MDALNVLLRAPESSVAELVRTLGAAGIGVTVSDSADAGSAPLDAILVDACDAPRLDDSLLVSARGHGDVPLLLLTDEDPDDDTVIRALSEGVSDVLTRPLHAAALGARVRSAVALRRLRAEVRSLDEELRRARESKRDLIRDPLTEVYSRATFDRQLASDAARSARYGDTLSCAVLLVDDLAELREERGALAADRALTRIADTLVSTVRACDTVARLEEATFAIILPQTGEEGARRAAQRILERLEGMRSDEPIPSSRAGVATLSASGDSAEAMLERAMRSAG
jgi:diguanylate cyclase (GGDEF)-like protein